MANDRNLMSAEELNARKTPEERKESARKAGKASGIAKRRTKTFKQLMGTYLGLAPVDPELKTKLKEAGMDPDDITNKALLVQSMFMAAVHGDVNAAKLVMSMTAEDVQHEELKIKQKELKLKQDSKKDDNDAALQKLDQVLEKMIGGTE